MHLPLVAALVSAAAAVRTGDFDLDGDGRTMEENPMEVCGGTEIWSSLGKGDELNVDWGYMEGVKEEHTKGETMRKETQEKKLEELTKRLAAQLEAEKLKSTQGEHHEKLIQAAFGEGSFQDAAAAKEWKCGRLRRKGKQRAPRGAFEASMDIFRLTSREFFHKEHVRLDGAAFLKECRSTLMHGDEADGETYCDQLCQQIKDIAQSDSYSAYGETVSASAKLKDEIEAVKQDLEEATSNIEECEADWSSLLKFREELDELKEKYTGCHEALRAAEDALEDLEWDMGDLQENITEQETELAEVLEELAEAGRDVASAKKAMEEAAEKSEAFTTQIIGLDTRLKGVREGLAQAEGANAMVGKLKEIVTDTMMKMVQFSKAGLMQPLLDLGFREDPEALTARFPDPVSTESAGMLKEALTQMHGFCSETAMPAFNEVKELVPELDLTPLCSFKDVDTMFGDLSEHASKRTQKIQKDLLQVVAWLNPWKANKKLSMSAARELEKKLVEEGQLMYLEQIKGVFAGKGFFKYLIQWRKGGSHHSLIEKLEEVVEDLQEMEEHFSEDLKEAQEALVEAQAAHEEAVKELEGAIAEQKLAEEEKAQLEEVIAEMKEQGRKMEQDAAAWRDKVAAARKALEEASRVLRKTYLEGIGQEEAEVPSRARSELEIEQLISEY